MHGPKNKIAHKLVRCLPTADHFNTVFLSSEQ